MFIEERTVDLNKYRSRAGQVKPIILRRGEKGQTQLKITVNDYDKTYSFSGMTAKFCAYTSAGEWVQTSATLSGNVATYTVGSDLTSSAGEVKVAYIEFSNSTDVLTSDNIPIIVLDNIDLTKDQANKYTPLIDDLIAKMNKALSDADTATKAANTAASSATTAANNANTARTNATNAATSANSAATSANNAAKSANDAAAKVTDAMATFKTIQSIKVEFATADQGTTAPSAGWSTTSPTAVKGKWIWTRTTITYNTGSPEIKYEAVYSGLDGSFAGEDRMTKLEQTVDSINDVTTGINLLRGTRDFRVGTNALATNTALLLFYSDGFAVTSGAWNKIVDEEGFTNLVFAANTTGTSENWWYRSSGFQAVGCSLLTVFAEVKVIEPINSDIQNFIRVIGRSDTGAEVTLNFSASWSTFSLDGSNTADWQKIVWNVDVSEALKAHPEVKYLLVDVCRRSAMTAGSFVMRKFKCEHGRINHPCWSPSPFDIDTINDYTTGVNLLRGTRDLPTGIQKVPKVFNGLSYDGVIYNSDQWEVIPSDGVTDYAIAKRKISTTASHMYFNPLFGDDIQGKKLTFSCEIKFDVQPDRNANIVQFMQQDANLGGSSTAGSYNASYGTLQDSGYDYRTIPTGEWIPYRFVYTAPQNFTEGGYIRVGLVGSNTDSSERYIRKPKIEYGSINNPVYSQSPLDVVDRNELTSVDVSTKYMLDSLNHPNAAGLTQQTNLNSEPFISPGEWWITNTDIALITDLPDNFNKSNLTFLQTRFFGRDNTRLQLLFQMYSGFYWRTIGSGGVAGGWNKVSHISDITATNLQGVVPIEKGGTNAKNITEARGNLGVLAYNIATFSSVEEDTYDFWQSHQADIYSCSSGTINGMGTYPLVINLGGYKTNDIVQLGINKGNGSGYLYIRNANSSSKGQPMTRFQRVAMASELTALTTQIATLQTALLSSGAITQKQLLAAEKEVQATLSTSTMELPSGEVQVEAELPSIEASTMELPVGELEVTTTPEVSTEDVMEVVTMEEPVTDETETKTVRRRKKSTE